MLSFIRMNSELTISNIQKVFDQWGEIQIALRLLPSWTKTRVSIYNWILVFPCGLEKHFSSPNSNIMGLSSKVRKDMFSFWVVLYWDTVPHFQRVLHTWSLSDLLHLTHFTRHDLKTWQVTEENKQTGLSMICGTKYYKFISSILI